MTSNCLLLLNVKALCQWTGFLSGNNQWIRSSKIFFLTQESLIQNPLSVMLHQYPGLCHYWQFMRGWVCAFKQCWTECLHANEIHIIVLLSVWGRKISVYHIKTLFIYCPSHLFHLSQTTQMLLNTDQIGQRQKASTLNFSSISFSLILALAVWKWCKRLRCYIPISSSSPLQESINLSPACTTQACVALACVLHCPCRL